MLIDWLPFQLATPAWLAGLAVLPILIAVSRRSMAALPFGQLRLVLAIRMIIVVLILLSLGGLTGVRRHSEIFAVFVADESASVDPAGAEIVQQFVTSSLKESGTNIGHDRYRFVRFAQTPRDTVHPVDSSRPSDVNAPVSDHSLLASSHDSQTNLQAALEFAASRIPGDYLPRIVLLSDGIQTTGDAMAFAAQTGISVWTVPLPVRSSPELLLSHLRVPPQIATREPFEIEVHVESNHACKALIEILIQEQLILAEQKPVHAGTNRFVFKQRLDRSSLLNVRVTALADSSTDEIDANQVQNSGRSELNSLDTFAQNNSLSTWMILAEPPEVLLIEGQRDPAESLPRALRQEGLQVEVGSVNELPATPLKLRRYDALILSNVSATDLSTSQMRTIRDYVATQGGGFLMLGGDQSFGPGGYYKTLVEEVLPVASDFQSEQEKPGLGMILVIDKSGSMGGQKIELAKDAAKAAVELLNPTDQLGVIAFDGSPYWVSPMADLSDKPGVLARISAVQVGGGTNLYPAIDQGFAALKTAETQLKHMLILTDGYSVPGDFEGISQALADAQITVSTVGIPDADPDLLKSIARTGRGRYYFANDPATVPQIFARETLTAGNNAMREDAFIPQLIQSAPALQDIDFKSAPPLHGYVVTRPKPTSEQILLTDRGDPLLAWWRFGLGTAAAFTSDTGTRWAAEWLTWEAYSRFWAQLVRHCLRTRTGTECEVTTRREGSEVVVNVISTDPEGGRLNHAATDVRVQTIDRTSSLHTAQQTAPGVYQCRFAAPQDGPLQVHIAQRHDGRVIHQRSVSLAHNYSDEFRAQPVNLELLQSLATATNGVFDPSPDQIFRPSPGEVVRQYVDLSPWLLRTVLLLLIVDVALRRFPLAKLFGTQSGSNSIQNPASGEEASPN